METRAALFSDQNDQRDDNSSELVDQHQSTHTKSGPLRLGSSHCPPQVLFPPVIIVRSCAARELRRFVAEGPTRAYDVTVFVSSSTPGVVRDSGLQVDRGRNRTAIVGHSCTLARSPL